MLEIRVGDQGQIVLSGRFDATQAEHADAALSKVQGRCVLDLRDLDYISSLGLGVLLKAHKRLSASGGGVVLTHLQPKIRDVLRYAGFDRLFEIVEGDVA